MLDCKSRFLGRKDGLVMAKDFPNPLWRSVVAVVMAISMLPWSAPAQDNSGFNVKKNVEIVLVNVVVRDKQGNVVKGLTRDDFAVQEDGKAQTLSSFDFEQTDTDALPPLESQPTIMGVLKNGTVKATPQQDKVDFHGRRVLVLFFDLSSMQPEEIERAVKSGVQFVEKQMTAADLVAVASLSSSITVNQDFTSDREALRKAIASLDPTSGQGYANGETGSTEGTADDSNSFTADDTEYNIFNTDRRLQAIEDISDSMKDIQQKKSIIYFSSGMSKTGVENQAALRNAINRAVRANVALYTMDLRGLQAIVPGGEAQSASLRGTSPYSGASVRSAMDSNFDSQETLSTLAADTGGKAFLDSNDFNQVFKQVQKDTSAYYMLSYHSTNPNRDGRYRKITVKCKVPNVKLEYRTGYYAPRDWKHSGNEDREQQLLDELSSDIPSTDLDVYLSAAYFRLSDNRFYVPVSLVVRGSQIPFVTAGDKDKATLDVIGLVQDEDKRPAGNVRDTVKLAVEESRAVRQKNVQYNTGFYLPSGKYHLKFVLRENEKGSVGSFETDLAIPDFKKTPLKVSAVVLGNQLQTAPKKKSDNPLVRDGQELIPNVTHVFAADQKLYFYYEVYEPARDTREVQGTGKAAAATPAPKNAVRVLTNIELFRGKVKVYESPLVEARQVAAPERKAAVFQFAVPLANLPAGLYTCQVNIIDDAAGAFAFPRLTMYVRDSSTKIATGGE
ncbi:MAG TPA: VWA domain-containing protein [Terriglobales bacterium]|nr:VWA domain-containing protein [Terriglobales bacterium]